MQYRFTSLLLICFSVPAGLANCANAGEPDLAPLVKLLTEFDDPALQLNLLKGMRQGLEGRRNVKMPADWPAAYKKLGRSESREVRDLALTLALIFGDEQAERSLRLTALDRVRSADERRRALERLVEQRAGELLPLLMELLDDESLRLDAVAALSAVDDPAVPRRLLELYPRFDAAEREAAIRTFASRPAYAAALLDAVEAGRLPAREISAFAARQIEALGDERLTARLVELWGELRTTSAERKVQIEQHKTWLTDEEIARGDLAQGRAVFEKNCGKCHRLFGRGGEIGPDLTGGNRANLDYFLHNVIDPSAEVARDYLVSTVVTGDGRVLSGIIVRRTEARITLQTPQERIVLAAADIGEIRPTGKSIMPEGQLDQLTHDEIRNLVLYLRSANLED